MVIQGFLLFWCGVLLPSYLNTKNNSRMDAFLADPLTSLKWYTLTYLFGQFISLETILIICYS